MLWTQITIESGTAELCSLFGVTPHMCVRLAFGAKLPLVHKELLFRRHCGRVTSGPRLTVNQIAAGEDS